MQLALASEPKTRKEYLMKRIPKIRSLLVVLTFVLAIPLNVVAAPPVYPDVIPLQNGFQPEGIALGAGHMFYTGSLNGGAVFRGDLRSGEVEMLAAPGARMSTGMKFDERSGLLFVSGGVFGTAYVFDGDSGKLIATYQLTSNTSFINDVILTRDAAYFTDSFQEQFYKLPLGPAGELPDFADVQTIPLGAGFDFDPTPGAFNANGIVASQDGSTLILINSSTGKLYRVDPTTGEAAAIDLGGATLPAGDGLVLRGHTLYVVQNAFNKVAVVDLDPGFASGVKTGELTSPYFRVPTTAALFGDALYLVNARFDQVPAGQPAPDDTFEAVRLPIH
jgi:sugar lactone lactonase YvrE